MRRELAYYFLFATAVACGLLGALAVGWALLPRPEYILAGAVADFPAQPAGPYVIDTDRARLFVVNSGQELIVLDGRSTTTNTRCTLKWVPVNQRFEDPCCGSKFTLDGTYITGRAVRNMDRYAVKIENGQVWVELSRSTPGAPRPADIP